MATRIEEITLEITETMAEKFATAAALGAKEPAKMAAEILSIQAEIKKAASDRMDKEKADSTKLAEAEVAGKKALETHAQDVLGTAAETLRDGYESLQTVGQIIARLGKDAKGKMTVDITMANLTKVGGGNGSRNYKCTVDGKQYDTVAQAWKGVMGDVAQPTKTVKDKSADGGERQTKTADVAITALKAAGHTVS